MSLSDHDLMRRSSAGDTGAFEQLVRRWEGPLARVLARLHTNGSDVEDLCQETFLKVLRAQGRYRPRSAFSTWLFSIALNVARDAARRRGREEQRVVKVSQRASIAGPPENAARRELVEHVSAALAQLAPPLREVLVLKHFGELTFAQLAELLRLPESTVKSRAHKALERLRREFKKRGIDQAELLP
jgi:RNA polymerase sigma-70 factor, ECF subfamily